jgi:hypothetical protein
MSASSMNTAMLLLLKILQEGSQAALLLLQTSLQMRN